MAMDSDRAAKNANEDYFNSHMKTALDAANIPADAQNQLKAENLALVTSVCKAIINEIVEHGETPVSEAVNGILKAISGATFAPQDGGATLKSTIVAALPQTVSEKIK